jgi:hypothetical protein
MHAYRPLPLHRVERNVPLKGGISAGTRAGRAGTRTVTTIVLSPYSRSGPYATSHTGPNVESRICTGLKKQETRSSRTTKASVGSSRSVEESELRSARIKERKNINVHNGAAADTHQ